MFYQLTPNIIKSSLITATKIQTSLIHLYLYRKKHLRFGNSSTGQPRNYVFTVPLNVRLCVYFTKNGTRQFDTLHTGNIGCFLSVDRVHIYSTKYTSNFMRIIDYDNLILKWRSFDLKQIFFILPALLCFFKIRDTRNQCLNIYSRYLFKHHMPYRL